jgi:polyhydroxybutyrate depolymerase
MHRTTLTLAGIVLVVLAVCARLVAAGASTSPIQQPSSGNPDLSGRWVLNPTLSEDAREKLQEAMGGRAAGGGRAGGGAARLGGRAGAGQAGEAREALRGLAVAPAALSIVQSGSDVTITDADDRSQTLRPDGRKVKETTPAGAALERVTKWSGGTLLTVVTSRAGLKLTQQFSRGDGPSLRVTVRLEHPRIGRPVEIRRVYDPAQAATAPPPSSASAPLPEPQSAAIVAESKLTEREWTLGGVTRTALIYVPANATTGSTPVVFAFHGHGGTARAASRWAYQTLWPEAICVYMQGLPTPGMTDPEGKLPGWQNAPGIQDDRDLKFFDEVLAALKRDYKIDEKRIYATGHSNGGGFTYLLWAARGEVFAAMAPSAAGPARNLASLKPKPALHLAGEHDDTVPFANQKRAMDAVRKLNACERDGKPWASVGTLVGTIYPSTSGAPFVSLIHPGTHTFPMEEAPALITRFFKENPRM